MAGLSLTWVQLAATVGVLQALPLIVVLLLQRNNRTANRLLAALMAAFSVYLAGFVYYSTDAVRAYPQFVGVSYQTPWVFGPLVYLYAVTASDRERRLRRRELLHFVPVLVSTLGALPIYLMGGPAKLALLERMQAGDLPRQLAILDPFKYVSGIAYSAATIVHLRAHRRRIEDSYSNPARVNLRWLVWLAAAAAFIWLMATTLRLSPVQALLRDEHITLAMALTVYLIGYMGLRQPEVFRFETAEFAIPAVIAAPPVAQPMVADARPQRYERSGLTGAEAVQIKAALLRLMDAEHPWEDSELTLADLADRLGTSPHKLSEVLNAQLGRTFYDFVNGYRVREVQRRITAGEAKTRKMLALAMDAGFASKSTFNDAFKRHTRQTPSRFRAAAGA